MYIKINNTRLFFDVYGSVLNVKANCVIEKPVLLVLHGGHGFIDHTLYVQFWSKFSNVAQVIFLDQRGVGRSDEVDVTECTLQNWAQDVVDFCAVLGIEKPIIAGVSMGGHVMGELVARYPRFPGGLIFCNTEAKFDLDAMVEMFRELGGDEVAETCRENFSQPSAEVVQKYKALCVPYYAKNAYSAEEINRCIQRPHIFKNYCRHHIHHFDYLSAMQNIQCLTLLMVGEKSPGHPPKIAEAMAEYIDKQCLTYHEFKGAGAPVYKDCPEEAYQVVESFIKSVVRG